jgi:hypothetical protein
MSQFSLPNGMDPPITEEQIYTFIKRDSLNEIQALCQRILTSKDISLILSALKAIRTCATQKSYSLHTLIQSVMSIDWFSPNGLVRRLCIGPGNNADVCQRHMNVLLEWASTSQLVASARPSSHLRPVLKQAVQQWLPCAPVEAALTRYLSSDSSSSLPPPPELLALLRFDESRQRVAHSLIANLCRLVPMYASISS